MDDQGTYLSYKTNSILVLLVFLAFTDLNGQDLHITRLHYDGGGDWYANPSSLPNLISFVSDNTNIRMDPEEYRVKITDTDLYNHPYLYMTGHGNVKFSNEEVHKLRDFLSTGGFLHADDNYGMDESFRREIKRVFPKKKWVDLPHDHPVFNNYFRFPNAYNYLVLLIVFLRTRNFYQGQCC